MSLKFVLQNINVIELEKTYNLGILSNIKRENVNNNNQTLLENLEIKKENRISFFDESKKVKTYDIVMKDIYGKDLNDIGKCFWDRCNFSNTPIGCPINYVSPKIYKSYYSQLTESVYTITENLNSEKAKIFTEKDINFAKGYYITEGCFCSFNCCLAYINEKRKDISCRENYRDSINLLHEIYFHLTGEKETIIPASDWKLIDENGGIIDISSYRKNFNNMYYTNGGLLRNLLNFFSVSYIYEKNHQI